MKIPPGCRRCRRRSYIVLAGACVKPGWRHKGRPEHDHGGTKDTASTTKAVAERGGRRRKKNSKSGRGKARERGGEKRGAHLLSRESFYLPFCIPHDSARAMHVYARLDLTRLLIPCFTQDAREHMSHCLCARIVQIKVTRNSSHVAHLFARIYDT